jgi:hypothetical protein
MVDTGSPDRLVYRTCRIRLRVTRHQANRCFRLLRSAGDLWAWLIDCNRRRQRQDAAPLVGYQALCRELTVTSGLGELSVVGARSVLQRYSDAWLEAARRRQRGQVAGFPRRKRALMPVRFHHGTFRLDGRWRVRLPVAKGCPALWVRLARPLPSGRPSPSRHPAGRDRSAVAGGHRRGARPAARPGSRSGRRGGPWHHPPVCGCQRAGRTADLGPAPSVPRTSSTSVISKPVRPRPRVVCPSPDSTGRGDGAVIERGDGMPKPGIVAASSRPSTRQPARSSPSRYATESALWSSEIPRASPTTTWAGSRTCACGSGGAPI